MPDNRRSWPLRAEIERMYGEVSSGACMNIHTGILRNDGVLMAALPLWLTSTDKGSRIELARCRNCGQVKATSDPCGFDHLAALMEFGAAIKPYTTLES